MPVYKDKERNTWFFEFKKVVNGDPIKRKKRGFNTKIDAQKAERDALAELEKNGNKAYAKSEMTMNELFNLFIEEKRMVNKIGTITGKKNIFKSHITSSLGKIQLRKLNDSDVTSWEKLLIQKNMTEDFTNKIIGVLRDLLNYGIRKGYPVDVALSNQLTKVKMYQMETERAVWTMEEVDRFLDTFDKETEKDFYEYFYAFSRTGMRPNEFRALTVQDIEGDYLVVNKNITSKIYGEGDIIQVPKNKTSNRKVVMPHEIIEMLKARTEGYKKTDFIFGKEKAFRETTLRRSLIAHAKLAHLKQIAIYGFRHSHATHLIRSGVPVKVVSKRLGHKNTSTTMNVYVHLLQDDELKALEALK